MKLITVLATAALLAGLATTASAATPDFDGKQIKLPTYGPIDRIVQECSIGTRGIFVAGQFGKSADGTGLPWRRGNRLAVFSLSSKPRTRGGVAVGRWRALPVPGDQIVFGSGFSAGGELVYVTGRPLSRGRARGLQVRRSTANGRPDRTFGTRGRIRLTNVDPAIGNDRMLKVRVLPSNSGTVIALQNSTSMEIHRVTANGVDRKWQKYSLARPAIGVVSVRSDGGVIVPAVVAGSPGTAIAKLRANGSPDTSFGSAGVWAAPQTTDSFNSTDALTPQRSVFGIAVGSASEADGSIQVAFANEYSNPINLTSVYRIAKISATGVTQVVSAARGEYSTGGDGGFPLKSPFIFGPAALGAILARADGWFDAGTTGFAATPASVGTLSLEKFTATAFATARSSRQLLACGLLPNRKANDRRQRRLALRLVDVG